MPRETSPSGCHTNERLVSSAETYPAAPADKCTKCSSCWPLVEESALHDRHRPLPIAQDLKGGDPGVVGQLLVRCAASSATEPGVVPSAGPRLPGPRVNRPGSPTAQPSRRDGPTSRRHRQRRAGDRGRHRHGAIRPRRPGPQKWLARRTLTADPSGRCPARLACPARDSAPDGRARSVRRAGGSVQDAADLIGIRPSTVKRQLADLRAFIIALLYSGGVSSFTPAQPVCSD
jgi:hypothetical protein